MESSTHVPPSLRHALAERLPDFTTLTARYDKDFQKPDPYTGKDIVGVRVDYHPAAEVPYTDVSTWSPLTVTLILREDHVTELRATREFDLNAHGVRWLMQRIVTEALDLPVCD